MIVTEKTIHKGEHFTAGTIINNLINGQGRIIVLRTSLIQILIIDTYMDGTLFLGNGRDVRNPFGQRYRINKIILEEFSTFALIVASFLG